MKRIVVPCDFSDESIQAFKCAVELGKKNKSQIFLLHIIELPVMHDTLLTPTMPFEIDLLKDVKTHAEKNFAVMKKKWGYEGVKINTVIEFGRVSSTIESFIEENKIDLVVMGTKGATGAKEVFIGSNTEKIVRRSVVPVLSVKKGFKLSAIKNIVFPNPLSVDDEALTQKVKALQAFFNAKLHVVYINTPANFKTSITTREAQNDFAKRYMLKNFTLNVFNDYDEEAGITNFAHQIKADLVALSTHGRRGFNNFIKGSIAEDVVNHIDCPIWTFRDPKSEN